MKIRIQDQLRTRIGLACTLGLALAWMPVAHAVELPPPAIGKIDFRTDIRPVLEQLCHGSVNAMNGLRLDRKANALAGGHSGPAIIPGDSAESRLIHLVAGFGVKVMMPPAGEPPGQSKIGKLRAWIDQGAVWPDDDGTS